MTSHNGNTALIAMIFNEAEDSLTTAQVVGELNKRGVIRSATQISALLRSAEVVGRFIRSEIDGRVHWTNNPEWAPRQSGRKAAAKPAVEPAVDLPPPQLRARPQRVPSPPLDPPEDDPVALLAQQPPLPAEKPAALAPVIRAADKAPFALVERLDAIAQDLQDALDDACKAELPYTLIAALVAANNATQLAARRLVA